MKLPLLDYTLTLFQKTNLSNVLIIAAQHILETNLTMFEYLFRLGLKPQNTFLIGKSYSTNKEVMEKFRAKGVYVHPGSIKFDSHLAYDSQYRTEVKDFLNYVKTTVNFEDYKKVLFVDDGGLLIYIANSSIKNFSNVFAVEQTSCGYHMLKDIKLNFPIINVARSDAKLVYESPFIAELFVEKLFKKIKLYKLKPKSALVVGAGYIGKEIFYLLKDKLETYLFDVKYQVSDFGKAKLEDVISNFDLIIGASGFETIKRNIYSKIRHGAVLVSASSSDREFCAVNLRKLVPKIKDCHEDFFVNSIWLLNCGSPLNFSGSKHSAPPEKIQLTRALMLSGICLAMEKKYKNDFIDLDSKYQKVIVEKFNQIDSASK